MRQQIYEDALKAILAMTRKYSLNPNFLLGEIERLALDALDRKSDPKDAHKP